MVHLFVRTVIICNRCKHKVHKSAALRLAYITAKTQHFCVRLGGFIKLNFFSLNIKWPRLTRKRRVFAVM